MYIYIYTYTNNMRDKFCTWVFARIGKMKFATQFPKRSMTVASATARSYVFSRPLPLILVARRRTPHAERVNREDVRTRSGDAWRASKGLR